MIFETMLYPSRELKFRQPVYKASGEFSHWHYFRLGEPMADYLYANNHPKPVYQWTGLVDKRGQDIYEGHFLKHRQYNKPYSDKRKWCEVIELVYWYQGHNKESYEGPDEIDEEIGEENCNTNAYHREVWAKDPSYYQCEPGFHTREIYNEKKYRYGDWSSFHRCEIVGDVISTPELFHRVTEALNV